MKRVVVLVMSLAWALSACSTAAQPGAANESSVKCVDIARDSMRMAGEGRSLEEICASIVSSYSQFGPLTLAAAQERHIQVNARMFAFEPGVLRVNRGDTVVLTVESEDVVHGLYVDGYGVNAQVEPGQNAQVRFVADRPGKFKSRCSISCGNLHPFMVGELVVEPNLPFWRAVTALLIAAVGATVAFWKS